MDKRIELSATVNEQLASPAGGDQNGYEGYTRRQLEVGARIFVTENLMLGAYHHYGLRRVDDQPGASVPGAENGLTASLWHRSGRTTIGGTANVALMGIESSQDNQYVSFGASTSIDHRIHPRLRFTASVGAQAVPQFIEVRLWGPGQFWNQYRASTSAGVGLDLWAFELIPQVGMHYAKDSGLEPQASLAVNVPFLGM